MSIKPKFTSREEAKKAGWFSRRHPTNKEREEARIRHKKRPNNEVST